MIGTTYRLTVFHLAGPVKMEQPGLGAVVVDTLGEAAIRSISRGKEVRAPLSSPKRI